VSGQTVRLGCCLAGIVILLQPGVGANAGDADPRERAQQLLEQGNGLFRQGDLARALRIYRDAYDTFASSKLFFNIALCEQGLGDRASAMRDFSRFLGESPDASADFRTEAEDNTRRLATVLAAIAITGPDNVVVQLDGAAAGLTPFKMPLWIEPGSHRVVVERVGQPAWSTIVVGDAGGRVSVVIPATETTDGSAEGPRRSDGTTNPRADAPAGSHRLWLWIGLGAILIGGALATYLILRNRCPPEASVCM
jgi:hypothetical protein